MLMLLVRTGIVRPVPAAGPDPDAVSVRADHRVTGRRPGSGAGTLTVTVLVVSPVISRQLLQQGGQAGEGVQDVVGGAGGGVVRAREVLAGLDQDPGEPLVLGG